MTRAVVTRVEDIETSIRSDWLTRRSIVAFLSVIGYSRLRFALFGALGFALGCAQEPGIQKIDVSLNPGQVFQYPTVGGAEEGARIAVQAQHFSLSEIRRNPDTRWVAVYVYQPADGFQGADYSEIEVLTGSDGASAPTRVTKIAFHFDVRD